MSFLLDTDILSTHLRRPSGLTHRFIQHSGRLYTSSVALAELYVWAHNRPDPARPLSAINSLLLQEIGLLDYDQDCAHEFGRVRSELRRSGIEVATFDLMIASTALVYDLTLVTHNTKDYQNIPNLRLEDWLTP